MQNDAVSEGGAFAASGAPAHAKAQNVVENIRRVAAAARAHGVPVIHVWFVVEPGAPGVTLNAPLFKVLAEHKAVVRGTWGAAPVEGLEPDLGDFVVEKMRMSAWEGTRLETILKALHRDTIINTGAWTNMSIEHTARTGADKGYVIITPEDCCATMNADWHRGLDRIRHAERRRGHQGGSCDRGAEGQMSWRRRGGDQASNKATTSISSTIDRSEPTKGAPDGE